ncbi:MAG: tRNA (adenosine(37)-N6)-threonylcarbamoyltransferase complex transferase subunit TsaD [Candidatus Peribacteraceae bacterium]|nr:tRNA (adenosine(37)-N6)-threonylcarbamoyltransferase complex transferase subunit TsaD [Candidatus Peribacteraceae bacterium]MDD5742461.1 tRNA (adenosine(37)-N6)-threonylcarbamoyltransferase complex transferase subunit TsaD [Candidatus Peribacteraceae bacterium]
MNVLGIETSCDETSAAVVTNGMTVRSCVIASSRDAFTRSGGVIPEQAAREQIRSIEPVIDHALEQAEADWQEIDAIAVTRGPGLLGSLLVGSVTARLLAALRKKPLIGVHHTLGHLSSTWLDAADQPQFPLLTLSASGGHTELWLRTALLHGELIGQTRDDAAGEAFDKGASMLSLPYPGGPSISRAGEAGDPEAFPFPHPLSGEDTLDFSYSGLKTALKYTLRDLPTDVLPHRIADLAASFEHAICTHLCDRVTRALHLHATVKEVHVTGGVSANRRLRMMLGSICGGRPVRFPVQLLYCTDNAAMIAAAGTALLQEYGNRACGPFMVAASLPSSTVFTFSKMPERSP